VAYLEDGAGDCGSGAGVDGGAVDNVEHDNAGDGGGDCCSGVAVGGSDGADGSGVDDYGSGISGDDVSCDSAFAVDSDDGGDGIGGGDDAYGSGVGGDYDVGVDVDSDDGNYVVKVVKIIVTIQKQIQEVVSDLYCRTVPSACSPISGIANNFSSLESHELTFTRKNFPGRH
jgi:hypothetical protein